MSRALSLADLPPDLRAKYAGKRGRPATTRAVKELKKAQEQFRRDLFFAMLKRAKLPMPHTEYRFDEQRMWRYDYAWPSHRTALEVDGGAFSGGRHTTGAGFRRDLEKLNAGTVQGWRIVRVLPEQLTTRHTETMLRRLLGTMSQETE